MRGKLGGWSEIPWGLEWDWVGDQGGLPRVRGGEEGTSRMMGKLEMTRVKTAARQLLPCPGPAPSRQRGWW